MKLVSRYDIFLVLISVSIMFFIFFQCKASRTGNVDVYVHGKLDRVINEPGSYKVYWKEKYLLTVEFDGENAWVHDSVCKHKICEKMGKINNKSGGSIICVPNEVVVEFERVKRKNIPDAQTW